MPGDRSMIQARDAARGDRFAQRLQLKSLSLPARVDELSDKNNSLVGRIDQLSQRKNSLQARIEDR
jgi:hypothetical protein